MDKTESASELDIPMDANLRRDARNKLISVRERLNQQRGPHSRWYNIADFAKHVEKTQNNWSWDVKRAARDYLKPSYSVQKVQKVPQPTHPPFPSNSYFQQTTQHPYYETIKGQVRTLRSLEKRMEQDTRAFHDHAMPQNVQLAMPNLELPTPNPFLIRWKGGYKMPKEVEDVHKEHTRLRSNIIRGYSKPSKLG